MPLVLISLLLGFVRPAAADEVAVSTPTRNIGQKVLGGVTGGAKTAGKQVVSSAKVLTRSLRRVALEIGSGVDTGKEVLDPFVPKGIDRLFDWDLRLVLRTEGLSLRGNYLNPPYFRKLSMDIRNRFDPYHKVGLGETRDDVYKGAGLHVPAQSRGWGVGFSGVKNEYWGMSLDYDKVIVRDGVDKTFDRTTTLGAGYTPLGDNDGKIWNYTLTASVNYEDVDSTVKSVETVKNGYGFALGPVFQYGLDQIPIPGTGWIPFVDRIKLDRYKIRLIYSDSEIHPAAWVLGADVTSYLTKRVRLSAGAQEVFLPGPDRGKFETKFGIGIIINFLDFRL